MAFGHVTLRVVEVLATASRHHADARWPPAFAAILLRMLSAGLAPSRRQLPAGRRDVRGIRARTRPENRAHLGLAAGSNRGPKHHGTVATVVQKPIAGSRRLAARSDSSDTKSGPSRRVDGFTS